MRPSQSIFFARSRSVGFRRLARGLVLTGLLAALISCGGGSDGGGGSFVPSPSGQVSSSSPATTYAIGGTVSGLAGSGLVLQNNTGDDLPQAADGSFRFHTALESGAAYAVTVKAQPSNPAQTCTVGNGSGTAMGEVTGVTVACSAPEPPPQPLPLPQVSTLAGSGVQGFADGSDTQASFNRPSGLTVDAGGNVYVADEGNSRIRKITPAGVVSTYSGTGVRSSSDGPPGKASFYAPDTVVMDASGTLYVGDLSVIRKITPAGVVSAFAGGAGDWLNGTGTNAGFWYLAGLAMHATSGDIYVGDENTIRKVTTPGAVVTTYAGRGGTHGAVYGSTNGPVGIATFGGPPMGVAVDAGGNIYVADSKNHMIRKITSAGMVSTLAGSGAPGSANGVGTAASFNRPQGIAVDASGNVYVADGGNTLVFGSSNNLIRKITPEGVVSTLAGTGVAGSADGFAPEASFYAPQAVAVDAIGNVYVADYWNHKIRKITLVAVPPPPTYAVGGSVSGLAGSGLVLQNNGRDDLPLAADGSFRFPKALGSTAGYLVTVKTQPSSPPRTCTVNQARGVVADASVDSVKVICSADGYPVGGTVTGLAGTGLVLQNNALEELAVTAGGVFTFPTPVARGAGYAVSVKVQPTRPAQTCILGNASGTVTGAVTSVTLTCSDPGPQVLVSTLAGSGVSGATNGTGAGASFDRPRSVAMDAGGNVYVADDYNKLIRKITPAGVVTTLAGSGAEGSADGVGTAASFTRPESVAVDAAGNVYVGDRNYAVAKNLIRRITPAGVVSTLAGGKPGGVDGTGSEAGFNGPTGLVVDASGNLYVADAESSRIRKVSPAGVVTTFAGFAGDGAADGPIGTASFRHPLGLAVDAGGNLYVADTENHTIRKISPAGIVSTLAGTVGAPGSDNGTGTAASFNLPAGIVVDAGGNLYVTEGGAVFPGGGSNTIRKITPAGVVSTYAGSGAYGVADGPGYDASFYTPQGLALDASGVLYVGDYYNYKVRKIAPAP
jgi:sugar lactone lactonase YvrE